jgi:hypothetical protein
MWSLFFSSYLPLFLLVAIRSIGRFNEVAIASGVFVLFGAMGTTLVLLTAPRKSRGRWALVQVENRDGDVAAYAATYLLPFLLVFAGNWQDLASMAAFIAFLGFVYVRSRLIYVNPVLTALGYRLWRVMAVTAGSWDPTDASAQPPPSWPRYILSRGVQLAPSDIVDAYEVTSDLLLRKADT